MVKKGKRSGFAVAVLATLAAITAAVIGVGLGFATAQTANIRNVEDFKEFSPALPSRVLDINGDLVTEFAAEERRELVSVEDLPQHLINAVLAREDIDFYKHKGFSVKGIVRALAGRLLLGKNLGGGSTITQQIAGTLYTDRAEMTLQRKVVELWWALQLERRYTKNEILELYLNYVIMGPGVYGVEAASKYFFGHGTKDITLAESAILAIQLSSPTRHNPLSNPDIAMDRQKAVLDRMVEYGLTTQEEADGSYNDFWDNFDYTRASVSAFYLREDKAPWFSEEVRRQLDTMMFGTMDYFRDGYTIYTTLNMRHQEAAERFMAQGLERANSADLQWASNVGISRAERTYMPIVDMLSLMFNVGSVHSATVSRTDHIAISRYANTINPIIDSMALMFGIDDVRGITNKGFDLVRQSLERSDVEGALITIESSTGQITAIVGGSRFSATNQFIRATQANVQTGSAFKPLYFSAAIDSKLITAATLMYDVPVVFHNTDGTQYIPINYNGAWNGGILMHKALAQSLNIPMIKVLDTIGFDAAISRASVLLNISDLSRFPRVYPLALGVTSTAPVNMARAYSVFANEGKEVTPFAIRRIEDRNGKVILDPEGDMLEQRRLNGTPQIISPQNAYVMNTLLSRSVFEGTMYTAARDGRFQYKDEDGKTFTMPIAGKTGTTQNWADAWVVGYSPYYTTAIWFGFDKPGSSLGTAGTGASLVGPVWGNYMREVHMGLPLKEFVRPSSGTVFATVCSVSGQLAGPDCNEGRVSLPFLQGTSPTKVCDVHGSTGTNATALYNIRTGASGFDTGSFTMPTLPAGIFDDIPTAPAAGNVNGNQQAAESDEETWIIIEDDRQ